MLYLLFVLYMLRQCTRMTTSKLNWKISAQSRSTKAFIFLMYSAEGEHSSYATNYVTWHAWIEKTKKCWQYQLPSKINVQIDNTVVSGWLTGNVYSVWRHSWAKERKSVIRSPSLLADYMTLWKWYCLMPPKIMFKRSGKQFAVLSGMAFWRNLITRNAQLLLS